MKGGSPSPDIGGGGAAAKLAGEGRRHPDCTCGSGGVNSCYRHYTFGLRNTSLGGMILVSLLFVKLAAALLPAPAADGEAGDEAFSAVLTASLLVSSYLGFWTYTFSRTMGAAAVLFRVSYPAALAFAAGVHAGPAAGVAAAHLVTAWAAGMLGYAHAEHRMHVGSEPAADAAVAAARASPPTPIEAQRLALAVARGAVSAILATLWLAARVAWMVAFFVPGGGGSAARSAMAELSALVWMALFFWIRFLLRERQALVVSMGFMTRVRFFYVAASGLIALFTLVSHWLWVYCLAMEMMAMAAFFGYTLAVNARCKEILLAREGRQQPGLAGLGDDTVLTAEKAHEEPASCLHPLSERNG